MFLNKHELNMGKPRFKRGLLRFEKRAQSAIHGFHYMPNTEGRKVRRPVEVWLNVAVDGASGRLLGRCTCTSADTRTRVCTLHVCISPRGEGVIPWLKIKNEDTSARKSKHKFGRPVTPRISPHVDPIW